MRAQHVMMKIPPVNASLAVNREAISDTSKIWKVGQILNATTEHGGDSLSKVLLRVGQYILETRTPVPLKQHILNSGIFFESKLHDQLSHPTTQKNLQARLSQDLKYQLLAANAELKQLNSGIAANKLSSPPLTQQQFDLLLKQLKLTGNKPQQLADRLLAVLPKSSLTQLINLLTGFQMQASATDDLQLLAQVLIQVTQQQAQVEQGRQSILEQLQFRLMLLDLGHQIEQSIHKLTSMQLQPLSREGHDLMLLLFNLVFKDNHQQFEVNFRLQQQHESSETDQESWQITLGFNFKTLGKVQSKIYLADNQVSMVFYTELSTTADRIQQLLPLLETGLTDAGLQVENLSIAKSPLKQKDVVDHCIHLLDETA